MNIVLNEREWAENAITGRQLGKAPAETLSRVARYYYHVEGYKKAEVRKKLEEFMLQCDPRIVLVKWSDLLDSIVRNVNKYRLIEIDGVDITQAELDVIAALDGTLIQRLAFTLLCVAKYWNLANPGNRSWVNTQDKDIMRMANIGTSIKRQSDMFYALREVGLLRFSRKVDSLNTQVRFVKEDSPVKLHINDFRNLGNQYLMYCGGPFMQCVQCGLTVKRQCNAQKYCPDCAAEVYLKQTVESTMRHRAARDTGKKAGRN